MMKPLGRVRTIQAIVLLSIGLIFGCGASSVAVTYFTLNPLNAEDMSGTGITMRTDNSENFSLGIGPIQLPAYLDRPQLVTRTGPNRLRVDEYNRWAASLEKDVLRVMSQNLKALTGIERIVEHPWNRKIRPDLAVSLEVHAFESQPNGEVVLRATFVLTDWRNAKPASLIREANISHKAAVGDYDAIVAAQSMALIDLSRRIAAAVVELGE